MIGYLRGEILESTDGKLTVGVSSGVTSVVGYSVAVPQSPAYSFFANGKSVELFVHTHVREDALDLYGFVTRSEKELFLTLLSVTGIGPKGALGILSRIEPEMLIQAVINGDKESLTKVPGIGKKTAERVVLELSDVLRKKREQGTLGKQGGATSNAGAGLSLGKHATGKNDAVSDARAALVGLGYREQDVNSMLNRVLEEWTDSERPGRAEDLIRTALRQLG